MQTLKLGDALPDMELLLPRGGGAAFALDMTEPDGTATILTGPVDLVLDGGFTFGGVVEMVYVFGDSTVDSAGNPVTEATPGAVQVSRVIFTLTGGDTILMGYGPRRAGVRYTPAGAGPLIVARGLACLQ